MPVGLQSRSTTIRNCNPSSEIICVLALPALLLLLGMLVHTNGSRAHIAHRVNCRYSTAFITPIFFIFLCLPGIYEDRAAFYRESSSGLYSKSLYALTMQLASVPYLIIASTLSSSVAYHLIPLRPGGYGYFWVMFSSFTFLAWMQGIAIGALTPTMATGTVAVMLPMNSECHSHPSPRSPSALFRASWHPINRTALTVKFTCPLSVHGSFNLFLWICCGER
jgi:hypothetical protein